MKTFGLLPIRREKQFEFPSLVAEQNLHHVREDIIHTFGKDVRKSWTNHKEFVKGRSYRSDLHSQLAPLASSHRLHHIGLIQRLHRFPTAGCIENARPPLNHTIR